MGSNSAQDLKTEFYFLYDDSRILKNKKGKLFCCILPPSSSFSTLTPQQSNTSLETMELCVQGYDDENKYVIEVGENDTTETMRQKVASATGLCEDSFHVGFGGKEEGEDITELSAGDTVVLTKSTNTAGADFARMCGCRGGRGDLASSQSAGGATCCDPGGQAGRPQ